MLEYSISVLKPIILINAMVCKEYYRENLYCIFSEAFQHACNVTILTVSNTTVLLLCKLFNSEQMIPMVLLLHMFFMKVAVSRITITKRALYVLLLD